MGLFTKKERIEISIPDMNCGHCEAKVSTALKSVKDITSFKVDLGSKKASLSVNSGLEFSVINEALTQAGYPARLID